MRYLVLRKRTDIDDTLFPDMIPEDASGHDLGFPFEVDTQEMTDRDVEDQLDDPNVEGLLPSIPFTLIEPVEELTAGPAPQTAWGIDAIAATNCPQDGDGVTVAVLDTGIDVAHPAFAGLSFDASNLMDFTVDERGRPGSAPDTHGHGTHVAGTIFGRHVNGIRIGAAPGVKNVLIAKVLGPNGGPSEVILNAIEWALRQRADVVSMSLGINFVKIVASLVEAGFPEGIAASRALEAYRSNVRLFDRIAALVDARVARGRGALLVAASGNESLRQKDPRFTAAVSPPAAADGFISVGAVKQTAVSTAPFSVAGFSNTGPLIAAPGVSILSAKLGGGLVAMNGYHMAAPHVAGVLALWTQKCFPDRNRPIGWAKDVLLEMESNAIPAPGLTRNDVGRGIVQAPGR